MPALRPTGRLGDLRKLTIPSDLSFGSRVFPPFITVVVEVDLLEVRRVTR